MDIDVVRQLYDEQYRRVGTVPNFRREEVPPVVRHIGELEPRSFISYTRLTAEILPDTIERETLYFKMIGHFLAWKVYDYDQPPDLLTQLEKRGFTIEEEEAILVLDVTELPERLRQAHHHDIRQITDPQAVKPLLAAVQDHAFHHQSSQWIGSELTETLKEHPHLLYLVAAYVDDAPVSAAWMTFNERASLFAGLFGGATLEAHRGKGLYSALIQARATEAQRRGIRYLHVDASPMSRPILEKIGFARLGTAWDAVFQEE